MKFVEWKDCCWGDLATLEYGKGLREYSGSECPVFGTNGQIGWHGTPLCNSPGIIIGRKGAYRGVHYSKLPFFVIDTAFYLKPKTADFDVKWAYYQLTNFDVNSIDSGSAIPSTSREAFYAITVSLPPLETQRKIAAILSAYDDLIENNTRRIQILEDMARHLYREWFVHFRFPGHENTPLVESALGPIPQGWKLTHFSEAAINFDRKRKPLSSMQRASMTGKYPYYGAAKIFDYINDYLFDGFFLLIAEDGSVTTTDRKPVLQLANGRFWVNNHAHIVQGRPPFSTEFLYLALSELDVTGYITGAAQPKVTQENLNRVDVVKPPQSVLKRFDDYVKPMFQNTDNLVKRNANLRATRDLLLPRLISGEVDVSGLGVVGGVEEKEETEETEKGSGEQGS